MPLVVLVLMTAWWAWVGRDPRPGSIVPLWRPPDGVSPGVAGALVDQRADVADVLATVLDLAARGYLQIREVHPAGVPAEGGDGARVARTILENVGLWTTEWQFLRSDEPLDPLAPFERTVVHSLFGMDRAVTMSAVAASFRERLPAIYRGIYDEMIGRGWFRHSPATTRREWIFLGCTLAAVGAALITWIAWPDLGAGLVASGGIVLAFSPVMPVVTRRGARVRDQLLGLREYVRRVERAEVEARHRGERAPNRFEEILPYAIALGVVDLWLEQFGGLTRDRASWYVVEGAPEPTAFSTSLRAFCGAAIDALSATRG